MANTKEIIHNDVHVNICSAIDGIGDIAAVAHTIAKAVEEKAICAKDVTADLINSSLEATKQFPDPDFCITTDESSTLGFLPWQIRITEF